MKQFVLLLVVVVLVSVVAAVSDEQLDELWRQFKEAHGKHFTDDAEDKLRRKVFGSNIDYIMAHNIRADLGHHGFKLGVNKYSDLTPEEYRKQLLGTRIPKDHVREQDTTDDDKRDVKYDSAYLPDSVDWRSKGYVTPIKDQGQCGSCWSFGATGALEGQNFKKTGKLVSLSEQNLIDCSTSYGNYGCDGGLPDNAFRYVIHNRGIDTEASYPYEARDGRCRFKRAAVGGTCSKKRDVSPAGDESALQAAVASVGPIAVAIDASHQSFQHYKSGVYDEQRCTDQVDHAVLAVGYGTEGGSDYWIIKNSWGITWGEQGYIKMSRNKSNQCAIASYASYPVV